MTCINSGDSHPEAMSRCYSSPVRRDKAGPEKSFDFPAVTKSAGAGIEI